MSQLIATDARRPDCKARQTSDQMTCEHCNTVWDMNDPDPPECGLTVIERLQAMGYNLDDLDRDNPYWPAGGDQ